MHEPSPSVSSEPTNAMRLALEAAYRFITQPEIMTPTRATYATAEYAALTKQLRHAMNKPEEASAGSDFNRTIHANLS